MAIKDLKPGEYTKTSIKMGGAAAAGQPAAPSQFLIAQLVEKIPGVPPSVEDAKYVVERFLMQEKDPNFAQRVPAGSPASVSRRTFR